MKIRKLNTLIIGATKFNIIWDKKQSGGSFNYRTKNIVIGTDNDVLGTFCVLVHEIKEILHVEQATRFDRMNDSEGYEFHYNHSEHTQLCSQLAGILYQFII